MSAGKRHILVGLVHFFFFFLLPLYSFCDASGHKRPNVRDFRMTRQIFSGHKNPHISNVRVEFSYTVSFGCISTILSAIDATACRENV